MSAHASVAAVVAATLALLTMPAGGQEPYRFRAGVELINVTATVTDRAGLVAPRLSKDDFIVYEDGQPVEVSHFSAERVPVSLGIILDTSGSMRGEKLVAARAALDRFLLTLLQPEDEYFLYRFDNAPHLITGWTSDRTAVQEAMGALRADGATALYDAVAAALPLLESGRNRKKALLVISDGNDSSSKVDLSSLEQMIRESDALVYAIGIDSPPPSAPPDGRGPGTGLRLQGRQPFPLPFGLPGRRPPPRTPPVPGSPPRTGPPREPKVSRPTERSKRGSAPETEGVDAAVLRGITDHSGGRTEIVSNTIDLGPTAARIADELGHQYFLAYPSRGLRDGQWHSIRVEVKDRAMRVRARSGYVAVR